MKLFTPGKVIGVMVLAGLIYGGWWWQQQGTAEASRPKYRTQPLDRGSILQRIAANGTLNPVTVVNVGTQISGTVIRLHADFNSAVKKGQVLAELDPSLLKAQIDQSEATRRSLMATWTLARSTLDRNQLLRERGFMSDAALDTARRDLHSAAVQIEALKAQIDRDKTNLSYSVIRSPIDGIVVDRTVDVGQTVAASFQTPTLFKIARDLTAMQIDTSVSEADIGSIKPGMPVGFTVDAFRDREFGGVVRVVRLNPTVQQNVVTYNVVIDVKNDTGVLLPGMTAQVAIVTARRDDVLRIPNAALRFRPADDANAAGARAAVDKGARAAVDTGADRASSATGAGKGGGAQPADKTARNNSPAMSADKGARDNSPAQSADKGAKDSGAKDKGPPPLVTGASGLIARPSSAPTPLVADAAQASARAAASRRGRAYKLSEAGDPIPVEVQTGIADIRFTEVVGDTLKDGDAVIVRELAAERPAAGAPGFRMRFF